uniref:RagB/SusD family nutrient uptake outer membrane protein n=1 Tax=Pedobacter schmidteae TaxID=2201271 RepID=UPI0013CF004C|nr:RagB/SusD family nutrient uptake outer membrane protein [Pedobacter schmidteae]
MKYIYYLMSMLVLVSLGSCKKFLITKPTDFISPENHYNTPEQLNSSLVGVYDILGSGPVYGTAYPSRIGMEADEGAYKDNSLLVGPQVYDFASGDNYVSNLWQNLYVGVGRANTFLANVDKNKSIAEEVRNQAKGEALFLRAYYYFLLVQNFGNIPLVLEPVLNPDDIRVAQSPAKVVYEQIIADMTKAEGLVAGIKKIGNAGRVSKSAVRGILARVCLYMAGAPVKDVAKYADASFWAKKVIDDTEAGHELNPSYADVFTKLARDEYDIKESIWEVEFWGNTTGAYREVGTLGAWLGIPSTNTTIIGNAYGFITANGTLWKKYPGVTSLVSEDIRREWNIASFSYNAAGVKTPIVTTSPASVFWTRFPGKYRRELEVVMPRANQQTPINYPLLRFSDVLLMYAEAENEINAAPPQLAIDCVNKVRQRGYGQGKVIKAITITNPGSNYTAPTITISGGGGATANIAAATTGVKGISSIVLTARGFGYTSAPTVTIGGATGSGAVATATLSNPVDANLTAFETASQTSFREAIQDERSRELCFEGLRKPDLIRWGVFVETMKLVLTDMNMELPGNLLPKTLAFKNVLPKHVLFPIPAHDMNLNKAMIQNQGW